jgi:ankyrin repeat protein
MADARAIIRAAYHGTLEEVRRLVQQDQGLLDADDGESTPLTAASGEGRVEVLRYLLGEGAQVNLRNPRDWTALERACYHGRREAVYVLLAHGADAAAADQNGWTPLMVASENGHTDVVALLLAHGCGDIDRRSREMLWTALHHVPSDGPPGVVRALLGAGADPHVVDGDGETPLAMALRRDDQEYVAVLQVRGRVFFRPSISSHRCRWGCSERGSTRHLQEWECRYLLSKARRLRDAATTLRHRQASGTMAVASSQAPAYVASRVEAGELLPEVGVRSRGVQEEGAQKRGGVDVEGLSVREVVVRHAVEGLRGELVRELMEVGGL